MINNRHKENEEILLKLVKEKITLKLFEVNIASKVSYFK